MVLYDDTSVYYYTLHYSLLMDPTYHTLERNCLQLDSHVQWGCAVYVAVIFTVTQLQPSCGTVAAALHCLVASWAKPNCTLYNPAQLSFSHPQSSFWTQAQFPIASLVLPDLINVIPAMQLHDETPIPTPSHHTISKNPTVGTTANRLSTHPAQRWALVNLAGQHQGRCYTVDTHNSI